VREREKVGEEGARRAREKGERGEVRESRR
jgi:hypothetical protein